MKKAEAAARRAEKERQRKKAAEDAAKVCLIYYFFLHSNFDFFKYDYLDVIVIIFFLYNYCINVIKRN